MTSLVFKPGYDCVMIQYRNCQKFQQYRLSTREAMEYDSKDLLSKHLFKILSALEVDEENIRTVGQTIEELTKWPNQIWQLGKAGKIIIELTKRLPAEDAHTDEELSAKLNIRGMPRDARNGFIPIEWDEEKK